MCWIASHCKLQQLNALLYVTHPTSPKLFESLHLRGPRSTHTRSQLTSCRHQTLRIRSSWCNRGDAPADLLTGTGDGMRFCTTWFGGELKTRSPARVCASIYIHAVHVHMHVRAVVLHETYNKTPAPSGSYSG